MSETNHKYELPDGTPAWITVDLLADTVTTWQPFYDGQLTTDDALEILLSVGRLFDCLEGVDVQAISGTGTSIEP